MKRVAVVTCRLDACFAQEAAQLRESAAFQAFLDARGSQQRPRRSLVEVAREIDAEVAAEGGEGESCDV